MTDPTPREEFEFLKIAGRERFAELGEPMKVTLAYLRDHMREAFEQTGVEYDEESALLVATIISGYDGLIELAREEGNIHLAQMLELMAETTTGGPALVFSAALTLNLD